MDIFQARAAKVISASMRRLAGGGFAEPALAMREMRWLARLCDAGQARMVNGWLAAHDARQSSRAARHQSRLTRIRAQRMRVRVRLRLVDSDKPARGS